MLRTPATKPLEELLERALSIFAALLGNGPAASDNSQADAELRSAVSESALRLAYVRGVHAIRIAESHLRAVLRSTQGEPIIFAAFAAGRAAFEQFALALWLLDLRIDATERIGRCWSIRFADQEQLSKYGAVATTNADQIRAVAAATMDQLVHDCPKLGLTVHHGRSGNVTWIGVPPLSWTDLIEQELKFSEGYRLYSAVAHGSLWATIRVGGQLKPGWDSASGTLPTDDAIDPAAMEMLVRHSIQGYTRVVLTAAGLFGWQPDVIRTSLRQNCAEVGLPDDWLFGPFEI